jgi:hypothetical protein
MKKFHPKNNVHQANQDLMRLLVAIPDVQEIISTLRKKYDIPADGFSSEDEVDIWNKKYLLSKHWENWDKDTRTIWDRCKKLSHDDRYIQHIRTFVLTSRITAPIYNFAITRNFSKNDNGEFAVKFYKRVTKEERKMLFECLDALMNAIDPDIIAERRPKQDIEENVSVFENYESMKASGNYVSINTKNGISYPFESQKIAKDRNEKMYQRVKKEIENRIGWDSTCSN